MKKLIYLIIPVMLGFACSSKQAPAEGEEVVSAEKEVETIVEETGVFFESLVDGAAVESPLTIKMGVKGMAVEPAGELHEGKGHHHLVIDGGFIEKGKVVPADSLNIHFGKGQTETVIELTPGKHTLTLQFADGLHQSYGQEWSTTIEVEVKNP
ncbi:MAG: DUF4399 domain-containing protein [Cyclobacteriaceae bacterium]|nr:DUF4399 domain-containing protein [Cyclobacteriaceae bacterium]